VLVVISALALSQVLLFPPGNDPRGYDVAVLIAMYSVVKYSRRRWPVYAAAVPVMIGLVIEVHRQVSRTAVPADPQVWILSLGSSTAVCATVWLTAYTVRTRRLYVAGLEERAATAERERDHLATIAVADERARIARDLHDVVAHSMAVMIVQADGADYAMDGDPGQARVAIKQVAATGREALADMSRLVNVLRDGDPGPADASDDRRRIGLDQLTALFDRARSAGLVVTEHHDGAPDGVPAAVEVTVFRVVQEALTNVLRHAGPAARIDVRLVHEATSVRVEVSDDGGGRRAAAVPTTGGHGLVGMRERVAVHGGHFEAGPQPAGGWRVAVDLPWH